MFFSFIFSSLCFLFCASIVRFLFGKWERAWLECEVKASDAVLLKKDGNRNWGERQGQTKNGGTLERELNSE